MGKEKSEVFKSEKGLTNTWRLSNDLGVNKNTMLVVGKDCYPIANNYLSNYLYKNTDENELPILVDIKCLEHAIVGGFELKMNYFSSITTKKDSEYNGIEGNIFIINPEVGSGSESRYIIDYTNGNFIRYFKDEYLYSNLTGHISDIGLAAKCGLLYDFIHYIIGWENVENPSKEDMYGIMDKFDEWFPKNTVELIDFISEVEENEIKIAKKESVSPYRNDEIDTIIEESIVESEVIENLKNNKLEIKEEKVMVHIGTVINPQDVFHIENYWIPSKKHMDLFKPDSDTVAKVYENDQVLIWVAEVFEEFDYKFTESSTFIKIGNILYCFNDEEGTTWMRRLDQEVEGYEEISVIPSLLRDLNKLILEVCELKNKENPFMENEIEELCLLFMGITSSDCNCNNIVELISFVEKKLSYKFKHLTSHFELPR